VGNPNYGLPARVLADEQLAAAKWLPGPLSQPSPPVQVSRQTYVRTGPAAPARGAIEPSIDTMVVKWDPGTGAETALQGRIARGQLLNFDRQKVTFVNPSDGLPQSLETDLHTGMVVVDLRGGESLPGRMRAKAPGELLLLDHDGRLVLRTESGDLGEYNALLAQHQPIREPRASDEEEDDRGPGGFLDGMLRGGTGGTTPGAGQRGGARSDD
jgi:hypothetical protein